MFEMIGNLLALMQSHSFFAARAESPRFVLHSRLIRRDPLFVVSSQQCSFHSGDYGSRAFLGLSKRQPMDQAASATIR